MVLNNVARGNTEDEQKRALLLHCAGLDVQDIFETLNEVGTTYREACTKLDEYFKPAVNSVYERHVFHQLCPQHRGNDDAVFNKTETASEIVRLW